jgi:tricorn protease-like protein
VASNQKQADRSSFNPTISADGRFVAFDSLATNLVGQDTNGVSDVFVHDRSTGETTRVSVTTDGDQATSHSRMPSISSDGRTVGFDSDAPNLVAGDTNEQNDAFVHDRVTGETTRVSVATDGSQTTAATGPVGAPGVSADGRYVTFPGTASNLVANDTNNTGDVFLHDRATGRPTRISVATDGTQGNGNSSISPRAVSADGRELAVSSTASNLSAEDHSPPSSILTDVFMRTLDDQD